MPSSIPCTPQHDLSAARRASSSIPSMPSSCHHPYHPCRPGNIVRAAEPIASTMRAHRGGCLAVVVVVANDISLLFIALFLCDDVFSVENIYPNKSTNHHLAALREVRALGAKKKERRPLKNEKENASASFRGNRVLCFVCVLCVSVVWLVWVCSVFRVGDCMCMCWFGVGGCMCMCGWRSLASRRRGRCTPPGTHAHVNVHVHVHIHAHEHAHAACIGLRESRSSHSKQAHVRDHS